MALGFFGLSAKVELLRSFTAKRRPAGRDLRPVRRRYLLQARKDSNPQPLVLETSALPIELLAYSVVG